jgi:hypothetical protein
MYESKSFATCRESTYSEVSEVNGRKGLQGFPVRLDRYSRGHDRALRMAGFAGALGTVEGRRRGQKLRQCGLHLGFRHYFTIDEIRLHEAFFCQQFKLCPLCAIRRGAKMLRRYVERMLLVVASRPRLAAHLVTFTVKDGENLGERVGQLTGALDDLHARRRMFNYAQEHPRAKRQPFTEAVRCLGSVGSVEVKRGTGSGLWHPHFHDAWLCEDPPDEEQLRHEWRELTGDSHIVNVTPFHYVSRAEPATAENLCRDFSEVFKYALKFAELELVDNWHAAQELHGRRLIRSHGLLFGVKVPEDLTDDPLTDADLPYVEWFYRFVAGQGYVLEHFDGDLPGEVASGQSCGYGAAAIDDSYAI